MVKLLCIALLLLLIISCNNKSQTTQKALKQTEININDSVTEIYIDSNTIGIKGLHKLEVKRIKGKDSIYAAILFSEKINNNWKIKQHFICEKDGVTGCFPIIKDYNNDGYYDFSYVSGIAARGANEIRTLFIFEKDSLMLIRNSALYPNIKYNVDIDCIEATAYYGGYTCYFLKLKQDSLALFASVDHFEDIREVNLYDANEKQISIKRDSFNMRKKGFTFYKSLVPLVEY